MARKLHIVATIDHVDRNFVVSEANTENGLDEFAIGWLEDFPRDIVMLIDEEAR